MDYSANLKKTLLISVLWHFTVFSLFSLSLGKRIPALNYPDVSFLGNILTGPESLLRERPLAFKSPGAVYRTNPGMMLPAKKQGNNTQVLSDLSQKPLAENVLNKDKYIFREEPRFPKYLARNNGAAITFHPLLPEHFNLYFKDRQTVHIELQFNLVDSRNESGSVAIKRKISSGNLEVDLLAMRYIGHYLFIHQPRFTPNNWQTIKIDLSNKND
ncbi:MAG: hypothetical protein PHN57_04330 [Candidatus Omnitrophica bacterium]|nr:hypothetical protein [Candidatus Omnitrophota bacterium]